MVKKEGGFTLIEVIVVAGIIAVLAGILVPLIFKEIDESKVARAAADIRSISSAIIVLKKDTGSWPASATCNSGATYMTGAGALPTITGPNWNTATPLAFDDVLNVDDAGCWGTAWKGPYFATVGRDPWGRAYLLNVDALISSSTTPVWIISAGPDGVLQTAATANIVNDGVDDIGIRIR